MLVEPPLIVIEILWPDHSYTETELRAQDYRRMGIRNIWLIQTLEPLVPVERMHGLRQGV
jgi:Uma2 family endonuclease